MSESRWALILGVSSGFGAAAARRLAEEGHGILGVHLDLRATRAQAADLQAELEGMGVPVRFHNVNAAAEPKRTAVLDDFQAEFGGAYIDVVMHSLAFGTLLPLAAGESTVSDKQLDMTLNVMAHSLVHWTADLRRRGLLRSGGRIFAMTSSGSERVFPSYGPVGAAKAALESHVRYLAAELAPEGVTVNALMAGLTMTPALRKIPGWEQLAERAAALNPSGRLTEPDDVARLLIQLLHPGSAWLTGNVLRVDGGETLAG